MTKINKYFPAIGEHLYMQSKTGSYYVDLVKRPYTVVSVFKDEIIIRAAKCIFDENDNYYDSLPISIEDDAAGKLEILHWSAKKGKWCMTENGRILDYGGQAYFGKWDYYPYLD